MELLLATQPLVNRLNCLKTDIPKKKENLKDTEERLSNAMNEAETLQISIAEPNSNLELSNFMLGDMTLLDESLKAVVRIQME